MAFAVYFRCAGVLRAGGLYKARSSTQKIRAASTSTQSRLPTRGPDAGLFDTKAPAGADAAFALGSSWFSTQKEGKIAGVLLLTIEMERSRRKIMQNRAFCVGT